MKRETSLCMNRNRFWVRRSTPRHTHILTFIQKVVPMHRETVPRWGDVLVPEMMIAYAAAVKRYHIEVDRRRASCEFDNVSLAYVIIIVCKACPLVEFEYCEVD